MILLLKTQKLEISLRTSFVPVSTFRLCFNSAEILEIKNWSILREIKRAGQQHLNSKNLTTQKGLVVTAVLSLVIPYKTSGPLLCSFILRKFQIQKGRAVYLMYIILQLSYSSDGFSSNQIVHGTLIVGTQIWLRASLPFLPLALKNTKLALITSALATQS